MTGSAASERRSRHSGYPPSGRHVTKGGADDPARDLLPVMTCWDGRAKWQKRGVSASDQAAGLGDVTGTAVRLGFPRRIGNMGRRLGRLECVPSRGNTFVQVGLSVRGAVRREERGHRQGRRRLREEDQHAPTARRPPTPTYIEAILCPVDKIPGMGGRGASATAGGTTYAATASRRNRGVA